MKRVCAVGLPVLLIAFSYPEGLSAQTQQQTHVNTKTELHAQTQTQLETQRKLQAEPPPAGRKGNRFLRVVTWPARTYYNETRDTFRDILHGKDSMYRVEAILLFAATTFDVATTIDAQKRDPTGREANPVQRALMGARPHGARPYVANLFVNTILLDMAHYQKDEKETSFYYNATFGVIFGTSLGHIVSGAYNLNTARCPTSPSCTANQPAAARDLLDARSRIMSAVPLDPVQRATPFGSLSHRPIFPE